MPGHLTWWGHATATIALSGVYLLTDPLLRGRVGPLRWAPGRPEVQERVGAGGKAAGGVGGSAAAEAGAGAGAGDAPVRSPTPPTAVLISHLHHDHLDVPSLDLLAPGTPVVAPRGARAAVRGLVRHPVVELSAGESVQWPGTDGSEVSVTAVPAAHDGRRFPYGAPLAALGYVVQAGSVRVYFAGDTDLHPVMDTLGASGLTAALLPIGGWGLTLGEGHLDPAGAAEATRRLHPRLVVPVHWGSLRVPGLWRARAHLHTNPGPAFVQEVRRVAPDTRVVVATPGIPVYLPPTPRVSQKAPGSG